MNFLLVSILVIVAAVLITARCYLANLYTELDFLRVENVALKLKLLELIGGEDDQA